MGDVHPHRGGSCWGVSPKMGVYTPHGGLNNSLFKGFYSILVQSRPHVSYSTSNRRKVSFRLCRTGGDAQESPSSLRHNRIFRRVLLSELQHVAESRWHLQRLRPSSPGKCGFNANALLFSRNRLSSISTVFGSDISLRRDSALYN